MTGQIRQIDNGDLDLIRAWRNHAGIRSFMFSPETISLKSHREWFELNSNHPKNKLLLYEENGKPVGFTQLKGKGEKYFIYEWGFYISPNASKGTGTRMLETVIKNAFESFNANKIYGEVLGFNHQSIRLHKHLGFNEEGVLRQHFFLNQKYHDVHCFGLLRGEAI